MSVLSFHSPIQLAARLALPQVATLNLGKTAASARIASYGPRTPRWLADEPAFIEPVCALRNPAVTGKNTGKNA
ncbi:MAG TPA: hypothetical protein VMH84_00360 [Xanthobacteraceae bacterium]|nr:hypothetical protein [Xanthobacteraceae bacterium]